MRFLPLCVLASALLSSTALMAQQFAPTVRIVEKIDDSQLVTLKGNTHPAASAKNDRGRVSGSLPMTDLILVLSRSPEQQAAFDKFVTSQYDSSSPSFHQWLTPDQVGAQYGAHETDIATITNWLTGHGFTVSQVTKDHLSIRFSGTAAQVESAFHTEIHNLEVKGVAHIGNMSDPQIPEALSPVVVGVKALHNFFPKPLHRMGSGVTRDSASGKWMRNGSRVADTAKLSLGEKAKAGLHGQAARPQFGIPVSANSGNNSYLVEDVGPYDFAAIYNILPLWNKGIDGTGQTIAIAGTSDVNENDIDTFRTFFGLPAYTSAEKPQIVHPNPSLPGGDDPGICTNASTTCSLDDLEENSLDVEWTGSIAPHAQIILVTALSQSATDDSLYDAESYIVDNVTARSVNVSYGECELGEGTSGNTQYNTLWQDAASEGIAVFVAAGDSGSASCDDGGDEGGNNLPYLAEFGLSVSGLASTPWNTAVGGTDFNWCPMTDAQCVASPYWSTTNNATTGASALGYVPEIPWNDTCTSPFALKWMENFWSGTASVTDNETGCNAFVDFAIDLENNNQGGLLYLVDTVGGSGGASNCTSSDGATVASCTGGYPRPSWQAGVTGIPSSPSTRLIPDVSFFASDGFLSSSAYLICVSEATEDSSCTYDTDAEPFAEEVGGTSVATPAMAGVMALINQMTGAAQGSPNAELYKLASQQTYSACSAETVTNSSKCYFNDIDAGTSGANPLPAAGTIAMACDDGEYNFGVVSPDCAVTDPGDAGGAGILTGYSSGTGYDLATGLGSLNVANVVNAWPATVGTSAVTVTVTPGLNPVTASQSLGVTGTVTGTLETSTNVNVAPTGLVTLTAGTYTASMALSSTGTYSFTVPGNSMTAGTDPLMVNYSGDVNYAAENGTASETVTETAPLTPTITVSPASSTLNSGSSLSVPVTVAGAGPTPTGTVTLSSGSYNLGPFMLVGGAYTFNIPANSLSAGSDALTVMYSGDANYISLSNNTATVTVTESTFGLSTPAIAVTPSGGVTPGNSASAVVTISDVAGYAGVVTVTCSLTTSPSGAADAPHCTGGGATLGVTLPSNTAQTLTFSVSTTAPSTTIEEDLKHKAAGDHGGWAGAGGGAVLAFLVFLGIPARRRSWRAMLGVLVLMVALGSLSGCGSSSNNGTTTVNDPGTTPGTYVFTVQGTGSPTVTPAVQATFSVVVN